MVKSFNLALGHSCIPNSDLQIIKVVFDRLRAPEARVLGGWRGQEREEMGFALRLLLLNPGCQFLSLWES